MSYPLLYKQECMLLAASTAKLVATLRLRSLRGLSWTPVSFSVLLEIDPREGNNSKADAPISCLLTFQYTMKGLNLTAMDWASGGNDTFGFTAITTLDELTHAIGRGAPRDWLGEHCKSSRVSH